MRSAQKTKPDPAHYQKIITRTSNRRNFFLDLACAIEDIEPEAPEARKLRRKCEFDYDQRIKSAVIQLGVAHRIVDEERRKQKAAGKWPAHYWPTPSELFPEAKS